MNTMLSVVGMDFSRDGKYLVMIGGVPDFNISVYDLENRQLLITPVAKLKCKKDFLKVKFNPRSSKEFFIMSSSTIEFYTLKEAFQFLEEEDRQDQESEAGGQNFIDSWRYEINEFNVSDIPDAKDQPVVFERAKWDSYNRVNLCTNLPKLF